MLEFHKRAFILVFTKIDKVNEQDLTTLLEKGKESFGKMIMFSPLIHFTSTL